MRKTVTVIITALSFLCISRAAGTLVRLDNWRLQLKPDNTSCILKKWLNQAETVRIPRSFRGYIDYRADLWVNAEDINKPLGLYLGEVADSDKTYINGVLIGQTGGFPPEYKNSMDVIREYFIPPHLLKINQPNEVRVLCYVRYYAKKGLDVSAVSVGSHCVKQNYQYFNTVKWNVLRLTFPILCLILMCISMPSFKNKDRRYINLTFLMALSFFIFGIARSRIIFHIFDLIVSYKILVLSGIVGVAALTLWAESLAGIKNQLTDIIVVGIACYYLAGILPKSDIEAAGHVYRSWFYVGTGLLLFASVITIWRYRSQFKLEIIGIWCLTLVGLHDTADALLRVNIPLLFDVGMSIFLLLNIISRILRMKKDIIEFHCNETKLQSDAKMARIALQIAHDIRSPISVLKGYVESVNTMDSDETLYKITALRSVNKLLKMAADLTDYAKADKINKSNTNINKLISENVFGEINEEARKKKLKLSYDAEDNITADIDGYKIERVLINLMKNAVQACSENGHVKLRTNRGNKDDLIFEVIDDGIGICETDKSKIFESYFTKGKKDGTGLGLSYCKQVIEAHGGTINVQSYIGRGTTFTVRIPNCVISEISSSTFGNI
jgi:signal transduction histidine kinase